MDHVFFVLSQKPVSLYFLFSAKLQFSLLTKGDNNMVDDRGLYAKRQLWLTRSNIMGLAQG